MKYADFEEVISPKRLERYLVACKKRKRKTVELYNANVTLAKETYGGNIRNDSIIYNACAKRKRKLTANLFVN